MRELAVGEGAAEVGEEGGYGLRVGEELAEEYGDQRDDEKGCVDVCYEKGF